VAATKPDLLIPSVACAGEPLRWWKRETEPSKLPFISAARSGWGGHNGLRQSCQQSLPESCDEGEDKSEFLSPLVSGIPGESAVKRGPCADDTVTASAGPYNGGARRRSRARGMTRWMVSGAFISPQRSAAACAHDSDPRDPHCSGTGVWVARWQWLKWAEFSLCGPDRLEFSFSFILFEFSLYQFEFGFQFPIPI
jgi:hypothetical protein